MVRLCYLPSSVPLATSVVALVSAARTSSNVIWRACSLAGSTWTRMAGYCWPPMATWATPEICEICWATTFSAKSSTWGSGTVSEFAETIRIGEVRRIDLAIGRRRRKIFRQARSGRGDRGLHVLRGAVDVAIEIELQRDHGRAERAHRDQQRHVPFNWTTAGKSDVRNYAEGQVLKFHRAVKGVARHESLEVIGVENGKVVARKARGEERQFTGKCFFFFFFFFFFF